MLVKNLQSKLRKIWWEVSHWQLLLQTKMIIIDRMQVVQAIQAAPAVIQDHLLVTRTVIVPLQMDLMLAIHLEI
uniref:Uncharacterized protein n=1 Tax=Arundo donax TaxID=35708 RepID=A0A0A9DV05_ARUDO